MTTPRTTEDGETCPNDISDHKPRTTSPVQPVTQALPQTGTDVGEPKNAQLVAWKATTQEDAKPDRTMNFGVPGAIETITAITLAGYPTALQHTQVHRRLPPTPFTTFY